jgi:ATPase subunit of ABC transporter with duplicated ATPase domains
MAQEEKQVSKRRRTLEKELEWVRMNPKGRQAKSKARLNNYEKLLGEEQHEKAKGLDMFIPNGPRLGNEVIEAQAVAKQFGEKLLYDNLNFKLPPAGIVGIIGPNGAGKTTIFRMIMDQLAPDSGKFITGETVKTSYVAQSHESMAPEKTLFELVGDGAEHFELGNQTMNVRAYLSRFNFTGPDQGKKVGILSGGERNRLHLAMALKEGGNVLLLDEPTNDLDINTLRSLEEGLEAFAGCAVIISHDRWFMDRVCTHILAFEGDSEVYYFEGSFSDYEANRKKRLGGGLEPRKFKYKKLMK